MTTNFGRWVANHRSRWHEGHTNAARLILLASGLPAWRLITNTMALRLHGTMHHAYAGELLNVVVTWTVPTGVTGNLNLAFNFRRFIDGTNPSSPESAQFGTGATAAPAGYVPKQRAVTITQAGTAPIFPGGLGGINADEDFYIDITRTGGTTLTGDAYIIGVEGYF